MPANLPPQYYQLEREFKAERNTAEKLRLAQELLRMMPKHKGTDKLQAEMKGKIAKLNKLLQGGEKAHGARQTRSHDHIDREGAAQVILIGPPNCGKSSLVQALTHARPLVGDYPYTTREPMAGMMTFETIQIQLIDSPPISSELFEPYLPNLIRQADLVVLVVDLAVAEFLRDAQHVVERLLEKRLKLTPSADEKFETSDVETKKTLLCGHKEYEDESGERRQELTAEFSGFDVVATSIIDDDSLAVFKRTVFEALSIMRVYTKHIGEPVRLVDPVILPRGGTVDDAARAIHKDFAYNLKFAKIWGEGKFDGQRVNGEYGLSDGDVVEFHL